MAWIEARNQGAATGWRVMWREASLKQQETFPSEAAAIEFKALVEASGGRWPRGWLKHVGWADEAPSAGPTFREWAEIALKARRKANDRTKADYRRDLDLHVYPLLGHLRLLDIEPKHVHEWHDALIKGRDGRRPLSAKTITNLHGLVSSLMDNALTHRPPLIDSNPFAGQLESLPSVRTEEMVFLEPDEFDQVLAHLPEHYRPLAILLAGTGLRFGEATALQVRDLKLTGSRSSLTVVRAWKRQPDSTYKLGEPKTRRARRTLALSPELVEVLRPLTVGKRPNDLVISSRMGYQLLNSTFHDAGWEPAVAKARVCKEHRVEQLGRTGRPVRLPKPCRCSGVLTKEPRIHDLRHSHASWLISAGLPLVAISRRLGHASITTTVDRYGHLMPELDDAINEAVDRALAGSRS